MIEIWSPQLTIVYIIDHYVRYFTDCYFPSLQTHLPEIKERVHKYFDEVKDKIKYDSYIIDFAIFDDKIKIIELNPYLFEMTEAYCKRYGENTGSGLFNWNKDQAILQNGPLEIRVVMEPHPQVKTDALLMGWKFHIQQALEKKEVKQCIVS